MTIKTQKITELRQRTGAGIMDIKKALTEAKGDEDKAIEILRKQGQKAAAKKQARETKEGLVRAYVHNTGKVGALVEVLCETDFVARNEEFKDLCNDLAMQIVATDPLYLKSSDVPAEVVTKEKDIQREALLAEGKPSELVEKILAGKMDKYFEEVCLLNQPFIKDEEKTIQDLITEKTAKLGEKIEIRRFQRFQI